jgi:hypothetical protein
MSTASTLAFFGLRFKIEDDAQIEALEKRTHVHQQSAKKASLDHYWANFDEPGERYYSFIGRRLGVIGLENQSEVAIAFENLEQIRRDTEDKLCAIGIEGVPRLYLQLMPDA